MSNRVAAVIAQGKHPVTFRTRKLSSAAPMVLHSGGCGRVGRRRTIFTPKGRPARGGLSSFPHTSTRTPATPKPLSHPCEGGRGEGYSAFSERFSALVRIRLSVLEEFRLLCGLWSSDGVRLISEG